ncbi:MAG: alpha/beta hydrolase [Acetobacteraceae bacterium]
MAEPAQQSWVKTPDGTTLAAWEWGNPDGPEILLVHGVAQCHLAFARQTASDLARDYRLLAYDLRGHGASEKPLEPFLYQDGTMWADDLNAVIAARCRRKPILVGWSMGGRVARQYLIHYGDSKLSGINFVASRVIEDPSVTGPGSPSLRSGQTADLAGQIDAAIAFLEACFHKQPSEEDFRVALAYNMLTPRPVREAIGTWRTDPAIVIAALRKVRVPTLITQGLADRVVLPRAAEMIGEAVKHAQISWYEGSGHSPFYEDAPRFNAELAKFAAEVSDSSM